MDIFWNLVGDRHVGGHDSTASTMVNVTTSDASFPFPLDGGKASSGPTHDRGGNARELFTVSKARNIAP